MRDAAVCKDAHRSGERVSPDTYRHVLDALPYGVLLSDPYENRTVYLNAPLQRMVRTTPAQRLEDVNYRTFLPTYQPWQALARAEHARRLRPRKAGTGSRAKCAGPTAPCSSRSASFNRSLLPASAS